MRAFHKQGHIYISIYIYIYIYIYTINRHLWLFSYCLNMLHIQTEVLTMQAIIYFMLQYNMKNHEKSKCTSGVLFFLMEKDLSQFCLWVRFMCLVALQLCNFFVWKLNMIQREIIDVKQTKVVFTSLNLKPLLGWIK